MKKETEEKVYILNDIWWFINPYTLTDEYEMLVIPFIFNKNNTKIKNLSNNMVSNITNIGERIRKNYNSVSVSPELYGCMYKAGCTLSFDNNRVLKGDNVIFNTKQTLEILAEEKLTKYLQLINKITGTTKTKTPVTETQIKKLTIVISEAFYQRDVEYTNQKNQRDRNKLISEETRDF